MDTAVVAVPIISFSICFLICCGCYRFRHRLQHQPDEMTSSYSTEYTPPYQYPANHDLISIHPQFPTFTQAYIVPIAPQPGTATIVPIHPSDMVTTAAE